MKRLCLFGFLLLSGCGGNWEYPQFVCDERNLQDGRCTKSHYACTAPLTLYTSKYGVICASTDPNEASVFKKVQKDN